EAGERLVGDYDTAASVVVHLEAPIAAAKNAGRVHHRQSRAPGLLPVMRPARLPHRPTARRPAVGGHCPAPHASGIDAGTPPDPFEQGTRQWNVNPHARASGASLPPRGRNFRLGTALRRKWTPTPAARMTQACVCRR